MANIMVNETCNLRCPYCFAEEFVNIAPREMTLDDFSTALNFVLGDETSGQIGITGGEPMLHSHIDEIMRTALDDRRSQYVTLLTNGVLLEHLKPEIFEHPKLRILVNCNSPEDIGKAAFKKMRQNLLLFKNEYKGEDRLCLSINIYKPDFDYSYLLPILDDFAFDLVRVSLSVPQKSQINGEMPLEYFGERKPVTVRLIDDMLHRGIVALFDCNFIPECIFTSDEKERLLKAKESMRKASAINYPSWFWDQAIFCEHSNCFPVIDILPDLQAIRCFGLSNNTKRDIRDFGSIQELVDHYVVAVDTPAIELWTDDACAECRSRKSGQCSGGCLLFKVDRILA